MMKPILSILGMMVSLGVAYGCDRWLLRLKADVFLNFNPIATLWQAGALTILVVGVLVLVALTTILQAGRVRWISWVFLVIGLIVTFFAPLTLTLLNWMPPLGIIESLMPGAFVLMAGAFIAVIGLAGILLPVKKMN